MEQPHTYPWGDDRPFNSYSNYFKRRFGQRVQKLSVDAGFSCPNRSGELAMREGGGCTFCNNNAFNPSYCQPQKSIAQQLDEGIEFHRNRYRGATGYLAYFQAYSNTYAPIEALKERYQQALDHKDIMGIVIGTRPDCVDDAKLDYIASLQEHYFVAVEYGIESCYDKTLRLVRRGHTFGATQQAIRATAERGIFCGGHLILGLPGESRDEMQAESDMLSQLPLNSLKLHQLQILNGSAMAEMVKCGEMEHNPFELNDYVGLVCDMVERLSPNIVLERFAGEVPPRFQASPQSSWRRSDGRLIRNEEIPVMIEKELLRRNSWQGKKYTKI